VVARWRVAGFFNSMECSNAPGGEEEPRSTLTQFMRQRFADA
jgi:hypothetical protein